MNNRHISNQHIVLCPFLSAVMIPCGFGPRCRRLTHIKKDR